MTREEFRHTFENYFEPVRNYIYYRSGDKELANDIAQETFLKYWEKSDQVNDTEKVKGLLYKIAGDMFISSRRRVKVIQKYHVLVRKDEYSQGPDEQLSFNETLKKYENALEVLPEKQRVVFLLNRMDGLKYHEIADNLGLSIKAVEKRMQKAIEFLRKMIY